MARIPIPLPPDGARIKIDRNKDIFINWGVPVAGTQVQFISNPDAIEELAQAQLSDKDISYLSMLRLNPSYFVEADCRVFETLMMSLQHWNPQPRYFKEWVKRFLAFVPPNFSMTERKDMHSSVWWHAQRGFTVPLTAFYLLSLRSGYWQQRLKTYELNECLDSFLCDDEFGTPKENLAILMGEPWCDAYQDSKFLTVMIQDREVLLTRHQTLHPAGLSQHQMRDLLRQLDFLSNVAAFEFGGFMKQFVNAYNRRFDQLAHAPIYRT